MSCVFMCGQSPHGNVVSVCLSLNMSHPPARQLVYLIPRVYNCSVPSSFLDDLPDLAQLCKGSKLPVPSPSKNIDSLLSAKGEKFVSFVKSEDFVDGKQCLSFCLSVCLSLSSFFTSFFLYFFPYLYHLCVQYLFTAEYFIIKR